MIYLFHFIYCSLFFLEVAVLRTGFSSRLRSNAVRKYPELPEFKVTKCTVEQKQAFVRAAEEIKETFLTHEEAFYSIISSSLIALKKPDTSK